MPALTNAASVSFLVTFSEPVSGVDTSDFSLTTSGVTGASITSISGSGSTRNVSVSTGSGDGTLRLDMLVTATITDLAGNALNNAPYTGGQTYTIDKTAPVVLSSTRANPNPTNAASVDFTITFPEAVTGVDSGDFSLSTNGITSAYRSPGSAARAQRAPSASAPARAAVDCAWTCSTTTRSPTVPATRSVEAALPTAPSPPGSSTPSTRPHPQPADWSPPTLTPSGGATYSFTVTYSDSLAIEITSVDGGDIRVTGPGGFNQLATLVGVTPAGSGTPRTATYQIMAPGGAWDSADGGTYIIALEANQVFDTVGNPINASCTGQLSGPA